ncbi:nuclear transport factor 2 family protein [Aequorivita echinoideorum]|uniref:nuclear transport factor 2 family protein n=1 Tax=Aequorivita echinoideorum TaxID=1549647 RepID=UPI001BD92787|nr:nuclear transport factor 2 family protein [Aequorivita echinoideorum]
MTNIFSQESFSEMEAKGIIDRFFEGFHEGDTLKMQSVMAEKMIMQTAFLDKSGMAKVTTENTEDFILAIAKRPENAIWDERLLSYKIEIDGNLAHVWTPYEFWLNGTFLHCGANSFTLAKFNDGWKIVHLIDSRRKEDCN